MAIYTGFSIENGDFPISFLYVYQRVPMIFALYPHLVMVKSPVWIGLPGAHGASARGPLGDPGGCRVLRQTHQGRWENWEDGDFMGFNGGYPLVN